MQFAIRIKHRWSGKVLFAWTGDADSEAKAKGEAVKAGLAAEANLCEADLCEADLCGANLLGADLCGADLCGANLRGANLCEANLLGANLCEADLCEADLCGANLLGADLCGADLCGANLRGANLCEANLLGADLSGADLSVANLSVANLREANLLGADLCGADLCGANLYGADLRGADLRGADLAPIRDDIWAVLCSSPAEVPALRQALIDGRVDGSTYEGECCCLVGSLANARHCHYYAIPTLKPDPSRPAERFFLAIKKGDTPATSQFSSLAVEWIDQWLTNMRAAFCEAK